MHAVGKNYTYPEHTPKSAMSLSLSPEAYLYNTTRAVPRRQQRVSHSASQATLPWTTLPTDVTIAENHNGRPRRFDPSQLGELL